MKIRTFASMSVMASLGLLTSIQAHALGLGNLELSSALNEPFKAEIPISSLGEKEAGNLQVQLASNDEFERAGLEKTAALRDLKFEIIKRQGATVISITSTRPFREPLVNFLLSASTGSGHLIREYTVLLDPPKSVFKQKSSAPIPAKAPVQKIKQTSTPTQYQSTQPSFTPQNASSYRVRNRDTLWTIALETRPEQTVTVHQMMMALLKENESAFINNNINGLKAGVTLATPSNAVINQLSDDQARVAVREQNATWKNRNRPQTRVTDAEDVDQIIAAPQQAAELETDGQQQSPASEPKSRLKLVSPDEEANVIAEDVDGLGNGPVSELSEQLTLAQQTIEQQAQDNIDIKARVAELEEQIETLRKLIAIDDPEFAKLQSKLEQEGTVADDDPALAKLSEEIIAALESDQQSDQPLVEEAAQAAKVTADDVTETTLATSSPEETAEPQTETKNKVAESVDKQPVPEQAAPAGLMKQAKALLAEYKVEAMSAGLVLLIAILLMARRGGGASGGRAKTWDEAIKEIEGNEPLPNFTGSQTREPVVSKPDVLLDSEEYKSVEELIQDADVFTSYGDLDKAKLTLEEVLKEEPENGTAIHKLLFVLFRQQNAAEFVTLAERFDVEHDSLEWAEIQAWGRELDPDNDLFKQAEEELVEEPAPEETSDEAGTTTNEPLDFDMSSETVPADDDLLAFTTQDSIDVEDSSDIDKALSLDEEEVELNTEASDELRLDISTDDFAETEDLSDAIVIEQTDDLELDLSDEFAEVTDEELELANEELNGDKKVEEVEFDLGDIGQIDESETKLDLASAYVDMGDPEGAKAILEEVLKEGSDDQKARAQAALNELN
jgi:pilus assembly protein FimV